MSNTPVYYNKGGLTPFDVIRAWGLDFFEGNIVKYICRWKEKGGLDDLIKARDYLNEMIFDRNGFYEETEPPNLTLSTYEDDEPDPFADPGWFEQGGE